MSVYPLVFQTNYTQPKFAQYSTDDSTMLIRPSYGVHSTYAIVPQKSPNSCPKSGSSTTTAASGVKIHGDDRTERNEKTSLHTYTHRNTHSRAEHPERTHARGSTKNIFRWSVCARRSFRELTERKSGRRRLSVWCATTAAAASRRAQSLPLRSRIYVCMVYNTAIPPHHLPLTKEQRAHASTRACDVEVALLLLYVCVSACALAQ